MPEAEVLNKGKTVLPLRPQGFLILYRQGLGLSVFPLAPGSKRPLVKWQEYEIRHPTDEEVASWWGGEGSKNNNIAVVCGHVSGGLVIQDFESEAAYRQFYVDSRQIEGATTVVRTPHGGVHVWLRELSEVPRRSIRISEDPPLDLLGEGGYAVAPWSVIDHSKCDGCGQTEESSYSPISVGLSVLEVEDVFGSTLRRAKEVGWKVRGSRRFDVEEVVGGVEEGQRNESAFRYARHLLFTVRLDPAAAFFELQRWNRQNRPPLAEKELRTVFESARHYHRRMKVY